MTPGKKGFGDIIQHTYSKRYYFVWYYHDSFRGDSFVSVFPDKVGGVFCPRAFKFVAKRFSWKWWRHIWDIFRN